jgi:phosphoenolpyruvate carboxykinase (diphosphate)
MVTNCESYLFQRPDDAIIRGYDKEAEHDMVQENTFLTNYEPLTKRCN